MADAAGRVLSLTGLSVPASYLGILLVLLFPIKMARLPAIGGGSLDDLLGRLRQLVLPRSPSASS